MITDSNQACFGKMSACGLQEEVLGGDIVLGTRIPPPSILLYTPN